MPRHFILDSDLQQHNDMDAEKHKLFINAIKSSKQSRNRLNTSIVTFQEDILDFNKQVEEVTVKAKRAKSNYRANAVVNTNLTRRIQIIRVLRTNLKLHQMAIDTKLKINEEFFGDFLKEVGDMLRLDTPAMVVDRHTTLRCMHEELFKEFNEKSTALNKLKERHIANLKKMDERNMIRYTEIMELTSILKRKENEVAQREAEVTMLMLQSSTAGVVIYHLRNAINSIVYNLQSLKDIPKESFHDDHKAIDFIESSFLNLTYAADKLREPQQRKTKMKQMDWRPSYETLYSDHTEHSRPKRTTKRKKVRAPQQKLGGSRRSMIAPVTCSLLTDTQYRYIVNHHAAKKNAEKNRSNNARRTMAIGSSASSEEITHTTPRNCILPDIAPRVDKVS